MSTQVQRRKGTTAQHASFTGASAELTVDTTKNTVVVHDGVTAGGIPLAKETGSAISVTSLTSSGAASIETTDNTNAALRITQLGTGNALLVEDSANPDVSPTVIDAGGNLIVGNTSRVSSTSLIEAHSAASVAGAPAIATYSWDAANAGGMLALYKSQSDVVGTRALVSSGASSDLRFYFDDGVTFQRGAAINGTVDGTPALNSMPGRLTFATTPSGSTTPVERMRIDSAGNLGIGTTAPVSRISSTGSSATDFKALTLRNSNGTTGSAAVLNFEASSGTEGDISSSAAQIKGIRTGAGTSGALAFWTSNSGVSAEGMRLDSSGNLGLGVTPSAWGASTKSLSIGASGAAFIEGRTDAFRLNIGLNAYDTGSDTWKYAVGLQASLYKQIDAQHQWFNAPSGTAGNAISFTQAMTLDASGNLGIGTTSPGAKLDVRTSSSGAAPVFARLANTAARAANQGATIGFWPNSDFTGAAEGAYISAVETTGTVTNSVSLIFGTGTGGTATEKMRLDASGNLLVGTTATTGSATNSKQLVGGIHSTVNGNSASTASGTAVTLFTSPNEATFMVTSYLFGTGAPTSYNAVAIVKVSNGTATITTISSATNMTLSVSGVNVQATQTSGASQAIAYSAMRIA